MGKGRSDSRKQLTGIEVKLAVIALVGCAFGLVLAFFKGDRDEAFNPRLLTLLPPPAYEGPLMVNSYLKSTQYLMKNAIVGPESMVSHEGFLYTGTATGEILRIEESTEVVSVFTRLGEGPCRGYQDEPICGRPLGMKIFKKHLFVMDAYLGLFQISLKNSSDVKLLYGDVVFGNDLDISSDGVIYFTDSSRKWQRRDVRKFFMEGTNDGQLQSYNLQTGHLKLLLTGLSFANGIRLSADQKSVFIAETILARIRKVQLDSLTTTFVGDFGNLPGFPDNIRFSPRGTLWVAFAISRRSDKFSLLDFASNKPWLRYAMYTAFRIGPLAGLVESFTKKGGVIAEYDLNGKLLRSLHDPDGSVVTSVSEVHEVNGILYFGSYYLPYLMKLKLPS